MSELTVAGLETLLAAERDRFVQSNPRSGALAADARQTWLHGVPMHWMVDWGSPFPVFIDRAAGVTLIDADGHALIDFCLGDTGAMFGHAPPAIAAVLADVTRTGLTTMLPSRDAIAVGALLRDRFGLDRWQVTATASDANRAVIRWARGITARPKILVFNGCYHGAVDDCFAGLSDGRIGNRPGLIGQVHDLAQTTVVIEFNDVEALQRALTPGDVACVLAEPVMTNCSMVLPEPGYHTELRRLTRATGTLLVIDETHTISSGPAAYTGSHGLEPDFFVMGKPVAGGVPAAVYGWTNAVQVRIERLLESREVGFSGIGTTLSGSALQLALMQVMLSEVMTEQAYADAMPMAAKLERGLAAAIDAACLPWHVVRVGLRVEIVPSRARPRNGGEALTLSHNTGLAALQLYALNRGIVITPFHGMLLVSPATTAEHVDAALAVLGNGMLTLAGHLQPQPA